MFRKDGHPTVRFLSRSRVARLRSSGCVRIAFLLDDSPGEASRSMPLGIAISSNVRTINTNIYSIRVNQSVLVESEIAPAAVGARPATMEAHSLGRFNRSRIIPKESPDPRNVPGLKAQMEQHQIYMDGTDC